MKKIYGTFALVVITSLFLSACLDALPEPEAPPPRYEGGGSQPFKVNGIPLSGIGRGRAAGYEDQGFEGRENIVVTILVHNGIILKVHADTRFETNFYGRDVGTAIANLITEKNSIDIDYNEKKFVNGEYVDVVSATTPFGGKPSLTINAVLKAADNAINELTEKVARGEPTIRITGGEKGNPWRFNDESIEGTASATFNGWMPHFNANTGKQKNTVWISLKDGEVEYLEWSSLNTTNNNVNNNATNDWNCLLFGRPILARIAQEVIANNHVNFDNLKIRDSDRFGATLPVEVKLQNINTDGSINIGGSGTYHRTRVIDKSSTVGELYKIDVMASATATYDQVKPAVREAFRQALVANIDLRTISF